MECRAAIAAIMAAAFCCEAAAHQGPAIDHVVAIAKPSSYDGRCPASIEFVGTIFVNYSARVSYRWERTDQATGPVETVQVNERGRGVYAHWQLSRPPGEVFRGGERLHVLSPGDFYSSFAEFTLVCR